LEKSGFVTRFALLNLQIALPNLQIAGMPGPQLRGSVGVVGEEEVVYRVLLAAESAG